MTKKEFLNTPQCLMHCSTLDKIGYALLYVLGSIAVCAALIGWCTYSDKRLTEYNATHTNYASTL